MPTARLLDRAVLLVSGPDAKTLLHNVLTADIRRADLSGAAYGALLTPQGKILWDFILHRYGKGYALDLRAEEIEGFAKRLALYRLRSKLEIAPAENLAVFVAWGEAPKGNGHADPRLAELGSRWLAEADAVAADSTAEEWHRHRIGFAVPEGGVDFPFGDTFPHDAAMDSLGGIDFAKGCYIGQEVVSRMRHRGTARRRIVAVTADADLPPPGADIVAAERPLGRLGSSADGRGVGIVRLDRARAALDAGLPIRAGAAEIQIALPSWATYGWPSSQAAEGE